MRSHALAPPSERWHPEILSWVLTGLRSGSAWLFVKPTRRSRANSNTCSSRDVNRVSRFGGLGLFEAFPAGIVRQPAQQRMLPPMEQRAGDIGWDLGQILCPSLVGG